MARGGSDALSAAFVCLSVAVRRERQDLGREDGKVLENIAGSLGPRLGGKRLEVALLRGSSSSDPVPLPAGSLQQGRLSDCLQQLRRTLVRRTFFFFFFFCCFFFCFCCWCCCFFCCCFFFCSFLVLIEIGAGCCHQLCLTKALLQPKKNTNFLSC